MFDRRRLERKLAGALAWEPGTAVDPLQQIRVPLTALGPPSTESMLKAALSIEAGAGAAARRSELQTARFTGRTLVLDPVGLRHAEVSRGLLGLLSPVRLNFAVHWGELESVAVETVRNPRMSMSQSRLVLVPHDPAGFRTRHPEMRLMNEVASVGRNAWMLSLGMSYQVDERVLSSVVDGLGRFAPQLFSGQIGHLTA